MALALVAGLVAPAAAQAPVSYRVSFPTPEHRWMQVEVTFADVPAGPLEVRMSRSSPGRYALHEFAKNVFDVCSISIDNCSTKTPPNAAGLSPYQAYKK